MNDESILFIGAGNLSTALLGGLIAQGFSANHLWVHDRHPEKMAALNDTLGIQSLSALNADALSAFSLVILAVKPISLPTLCPTLTLAPHTLLISVAAGVPTHCFKRWVGEGSPIVRAMPNTPAHVNASMTGLFTNDTLSLPQKEQITTLFSAIGEVLWFPKESDLDTVTALSGSGPGYLFAILEAFVDAGVEAGLQEADARLLATQTMLGTATLALADDTPLATLRERVTSKGGTTEAGLAALSSGHLHDTLTSAVRQARQRAQTLAAQAEKEQ